MEAELLKRESDIEEGKLKVEKVKWNWRETVKI